MSRAVAVRRGVLLVVVMMVVVVTTTTIVSGLAPPTLTMTMVGVVSFVESLDHALHGVAGSGFWWLRLLLIITGCSWESGEVDPRAGGSV